MKVINTVFFFLILGKLLSISKTLENVQRLYYITANVIMKVFLKNILEKIDMYQLVGFSNR